MSKNMSFGRHILIVSDSDDEISDIHHLLSGDFGSCLTAPDGAEGIAFFYKHKPWLLILAFNVIEDAENFYLQLRQSNSNICDIRHQTLLLCHNNESDKSYQLCIDGTFNDYAVVKPLYDPNRFRLSVFKALQPHKQAPALNVKIETISFGLRQLERFIEQQFMSEDNQQHETTRKFHFFTQMLAADLEKLKNILLNSTFGIGVSVVGEQRLKFQFQQFLKITANKENQKVIGQMGSSYKWLKEILSGYMEYMKNLKDTHSGDKNRSVMLIDDDNFYRMTLSTLLEEAGMQVIGVEDAESALTELESTRPDVILLEYLLPGLDGIELLIKLKASSDAKSIPIIMLTSINERELVSKSMREGASGFIVKPSGRTAIFANIEKAINAEQSLK